MARLPQNKSYNIKEKFPEILKECMGLVTNACDKAGIGRSAYYDWRKSDPVFAKMCDDVQEHVGDFVESKLYKLINEGNASAIIFFSKTKLKNRGYVERIETTGKDGAAIETKVSFATDKTDERIIQEYKAKLITGQSNL